MQSLQVADFKLENLLTTAFVHGLDHDALVKRYKSNPIVAGSEATAIIRGFPHNSQWRIESVMAVLCATGDSKGIDFVKSYLDQHFENPNPTIQAGVRTGLRSLGRLVWDAGQPANTYEGIVADELIGYLVEKLLQAQASSKRADQSVKAAQSSVTRAASLPVAKEQVQAATAAEIAAAIALRLAGSDNYKLYNRNDVVAPRDASGPQAAAMVTPETPGSFRSNVFESLEEFR